MAAKNLFFTFDVLAELVKSTSDFKLQIIAFGGLQAKLEQYSRQLGLADQVEFLGTKGVTETAEYFRRALCLILFSTNESFGKVIVEAGLAETPTIASRTLGAQTIIKDGLTGWLVDINDQAASVAALKNLLSNPAAAIKLGQQARLDYTQRFDRAANIQAIIKLWRDLLTA